MGSQSAILLTQWLGENDTDEMASMIGSGQVTTSDWMILALSQMSGQAQANKVGQAFVQKLLEIGDNEAKPSPWRQIAVRVDQHSAKIVEGEVFQHVGAVDGSATPLRHRKSANDVAILDACRPAR